MLLTWTPLVLFLVEFINTYSFLQERLEGVKEKLQKLEASVSNSSIFDDSDEKDNKLINEIDYVFFLQKALATWKFIRVFLC